MLNNKHCKTFYQNVLIFTPCKKLCVHIHNLFIEIPQDIIGIVS